MRLTRLQADGLKSLRGLDLELPPLLAITGDNGSGKSALRQALTVALLGYDPAIGKRLQDTRGELAADGEEFDVAATFDTGFGIRRTVGRSMEIRVSPADGERTDAELQARIDSETGAFMLALDLRTFTGKTPELRKEWLFNLLPRRLGDVSVDHFRRFLAYAEADEWTQRAIDHLWAEAVQQHSSPVDGLAAAIEMTHKQLLTVDQQRKDQIAVVTAADRDAERAGEQLAAYDPERATTLQAELSLVEQQIGEARQVAEAAQHAATAVAEREHQRQVLQLLLQQATDGLTTATGNLELLRLRPAPDLAALRAEEERATARARSQREAVTYTAGEAERLGATAREKVLALRATEARRDKLAASDTCPECGGTDSLAQMRATLAADIEILQAEALALHAELEKAQADAREAEATQRGLDQAEAAARRALDLAQQAAAQLERAERDFATCTERLAAAEAELARVDAVPLPPAPADAPDLRPLQARAVEIREQLRAEQELARAAGKAEAEKERGAREQLKLEQLEGKTERLRALHKGLQLLRAETIQQMVAPVEQHAQEILGAVDPAKVFRFVFEREGRPVCDFGFEERGTFRSFKAASDGEQQLLAVAFVAAMLDTVRPPWRVLLVDGAQNLDARRRRALMEALARLQDRFDNVFINGCCEFQPVPGWEIMDARELAPVQLADAA
jgi:energy-coupling factor transporter ATP-binding protein EcfA2